MFKRKISHFKSDLINNEYLGLRRDAFIVDKSSEKCP